MSVGTITASLFRDLIIFQNCLLLALFLNEKIDKYKIRHTKKEMEGVNDHMVYWNEFKDWDFTTTKHLDFDN